MAARTVADHQALISDLLESLSRNRATENLPVTSDAVTADPDRYRLRVLAHDLLSPSDLPAFDNSQMDGYAVRREDLAAAAPDQPVLLSLAPQVNAGDAASAQLPGYATAVMTGAPIPAGADAVVPVEQVDPPRFAAHAAAAAFERQPTRDAFIRRAGSDVRAGDVLLPAGTALRPAQYGVIAGTGLREIEVFRRPRVLLVPTGHEIREPGSTLAVGQIFDANSTLLGLALLDAGCDITVTPCRSDDSADLQAILEANADGADLLITVGGVSAGAREVIRDTLEPVGVEFTSVAMQPGGPQGLGAIPLGGRSDPLPVVCFPGNPVSALVSFEMFLRPLLRSLAGSPHPERPRQRATLAADVDSPAGKHQVRRGRFDPDGRVELVGGPSSHLLSSYANSSLLVQLPADVEQARAGDDVEVWRIDD